MATNGFLNMVGIMLASGALAFLSDYLRLTPDSILLIFGVLTLISSLYVLSIVPEFLVRFSLWLLTHTVYRIRIVGQENGPLDGPALLVCNHLSHVGSCLQRFVGSSFTSRTFEHWASIDR
jgi:acyl-[acyl-carrier-protein]-phospholipid O-acyltransferase/long-chain-fatty-acid--[acyl-carrier-protein] ligase